MEPQDALHETAVHPAYTSSNSSLNVLEDILSNSDQNVAEPIGTVTEILTAKQIPVPLDTYCHLSQAIQLKTH
jgi:hypothetical protein